MPSNIQVFVRFKEHSVFAGEEIQSTITFKNVASTSDNAADYKDWQSKGWPSSATGEHSRTGGSANLSMQNPRQAAINIHGARKTPNSGHRTTASLSIPFKGALNSGSTSWTAPPATDSSTSNRHQRSVSIISLGSPDVGTEEIRRAIFPSRSRPPIQHSRSATLQANPRGKEGSPGGQTRSSDARQFKVPLRKPSGVLQGLEAMERSHRPATASSHTSGSASNSRQVSRRPTPSPEDFKFPPSPTEGPATGRPVHLPQSGSYQSSKDEDDVTRIPSRLSPSGIIGQRTMVLAATSVAESNRSSGDFQSLSNKSQETLISEQASSVPGGHRFQSLMMRQHYRIDSTSAVKTSSAETLLMGYAQINATFTLDGALVDQTPFEEVKRKGYLGGQGGGGVVGIKAPSKSGGFLGGFGLNSIGDSFGGLLGGTDLSSLKEMRDVASSRAIPLLSTTQSLLFVDLTLRPGEEKSFSYRYTLPKGLPASYKGKAIKITYNLNVCVQGVPGEKAVRAVRRVDIPFKVFTGVNDDGEILGHDLMQPYVILKDTSHTEPVESPSTFSLPISGVPAKDTNAATDDFLVYVDTLLNKRRRRQSSSATLEPPRGLLQDNGGSNRAKEAVDRAIFLAKQNSAHQSSNKFEIARSGRRVATIVLDRKLHRLGESVIASVDLSNAELPCYSLRCTLESTETVNPALALRSAASITRLSRKVYQSQSENALFAERVVFSASIPLSATPTLMTSGVNLDWGLRFEFATSRQAANTTEEKDQFTKEELLEAVAEDDRGSVFAAAEMLQCETFEVSIPITVYGDTVVSTTEVGDDFGFLI